MIPTLQTMVVLLVVVASVAVAAVRLKVPPAILLVIVGVVLALVPGLPSLELEPDLVLLLVLPPLVYDAAVSMSWHEFRSNLRPIALQAVGCVVFTTVAIAAATHYWLGFPWAVGFVLGAIVSPPDTMAPLSIARRLQIPHRLLVVLEGEGLANDATALILYRFAVAAVAAGAFSLPTALGTFAAIIIGEIVWGVGVGWMMLRLRRWVRDPHVEITLSILTPFIAYWPPQYVGGSGVLATLAAGLYISWNGLRLISAATRLQGIFFWDLLIYLTEGLVFVITGLQARPLIARIGHYPVPALAISAALVCAVVILARFVWVYPAAYLSRWLIPAVRRRDPSPPWRWVFALAFTGVRGIVSLAAALAIPFTIAGGTVFPDRDLILFLTFAVIVVTLVGQGLILPAVIRWLGLAHAGRRERHADRDEELKARRHAVEAAIARLAEIRKTRHLPDSVAHPLHHRHHDRLKHLSNLIEGDEDHRKLTELDDEIELLLIAAERESINELFREGTLKAEARRRIERELDLREAHLNNQRAEE